MAKGYQSYRGRTSSGRRALTVLLVLILLTACGFLYLQRYITYRDDGGMSIELPFWHLDLPAPAQTPPPEEEDPEEPGLPTVDLVIEPPEEEEPEPEEPVDLFGEHKLVELAALPADGEALTQLLAERGASGFLYTVRDDSGKVYFSADVVQKQAAPANAADTETMRALCAVEGVTSVARFNCLHDSYYAFAHMAEAAVCQANGYVWYDNRNWYWLDADKEGARQYVVDLAVECAKLGYDELLLEELCYPTRGKLEKISYAKNTLSKTEALELLLTEMRTALEPYGTRLSLLVTQELLLSGKDEVSGVDLSVLLPLVDGVYGETDSAVASQALVDALVEGEEKPVFVPLTGATEGERWCLPK
ncbi:MAG: putative glycoside hydrolase [Oscillospiraceae bacterium]|nr:putative glycoside hydrolase [Oscillospiraceae bacterium]